MSRNGISLSMLPPHDGSDVDAPSCSADTRFTDSCAACADVYISFRTIIGSALRYTSRDENFGRPSTRRMCAKRHGSTFSWSRIGPAINHLPFPAIAGSRQHSRRMRARITYIIT
ncbi:hypothetical protein I4F81_012345 [Pyropia yezoensis]|uniref:Uncharacterized protein n=1 Tax=Pyropia yezoensis TaxID=2788 RepID=A0ACC3CI46_PYRYE|nr:hypothetical protein I4F81_012345 [Neopyropia yezoensis]